MLEHTPDTGWPADNHDWLKHVALVCLINVDSNKFILTDNKCFFIVIQTDMRVNYLMKKPFYFTHLLP